MPRKEWEYKTQSQEHGAEYQLFHRRKALLFFVHKKKPLSAIRAEKAHECHDVITPPEAEGYLHGIISHYHNKKSFFCQSRLTKQVFLITINQEFIFVSDDETSPAERACSERGRVETLSFSAAGQPLLSFAGMTGAPRPR